MKSIFLYITVFTLFLFACNRSSDVPTNRIGDVNMIDTQINIRNWRIIGPFVDSAECSWDDKSAPAELNEQDKIDYSKFQQYKSFTGKVYKEKSDFVRFWGRENGVSATVNNGNELYNFGSKGAFIIEFKVKQIRGNSFAYMLAKRASHQKGQTGWSIVMDHQVWQINFGKPDQADLVVKGDFINDGVWHDISVTCIQDGNKRSIKTFTDGKFNNESHLLTDWGSLDSTAPLTIGYLPNSGPRPVNFYINDIRIWNGKLPQLLSTWPCTDGKDGIFKNGKLKGNDFVIRGEFSTEKLHAPIFSAAGLNIKDYRDDINYTQRNDYMDVFKILQLDAGQSAAYCETVINSAIDQDVVLLMGIEKAAKIWVNDHLYFRKEVNGSLSKNAVSLVVPLKKGNNRVVMKLYNNKPHMRFHFDVASVKYAKETAIGTNFYSISDKYLYKEGDSLFLRLNYPQFISTKKPVQLQITDINGVVVMYKKFPVKQKWVVPLTGFSLGTYQYQLITDQDTFKHAFVYGDHNKIVAEFIKEANPNIISDLQKINIETLYKRFNNLDSFGIRNKYDEALERKIGATVFELGLLTKRLDSSKDVFANISGQHLRGFRSEIDAAEDYYMVFVPETYVPKKKIPLIVMMSYVTKQAPFYASFRVSDIDRIEYLQTLARKHGFAIVWPNSRIYQQYNVAPIVAKATLEAINQVKRDYAIDEDRVYIYGDCSGGLQALLMANRYPSTFAALGVEGPEMGFTETDSTSVDPKPEVTYNRVLNTVQNFRNMPLLLMHSQNDHKAPFQLSDQLVTQLNKIGGTAILNDMNNPMKGETDKVKKMIPENAIMRDIFNFFMGKWRKVPDTIMFATAQLKYNKAYWITIDEFRKAGKASITAIAKVENRIDLQTSNVRGLTVHVFGIPGIDRDKKVKVLLNEEEVYNGYCRKGSLYIAQKVSGKRISFVKNATIEGPINHTFAKGFILVKGTTGGVAVRSAFDAGIDSLSVNWKTSYFGSYRMKKDLEIDSVDIENYNLVLIGNDQTNLFIKKILPHLPLQVFKDYIRLKGKKYIGTDIGYSMIYPNPLNPRKYVLIIGSNSGHIGNSQINNLALNGWYDYEICQRTKLLDQGTFNKYWQ